MTIDPVAVALEVLALPDDDFFGFDNAAATSLQARLAREAQPPPMSGPPTQASSPLPELRVISAPKDLDWGRRSAFPMLLAEIRSNRREWEVHAGQNRLLLMSNLDTGAVDPMAPLDAGRRMPVRPPSRSGEPPDEFDGSLSMIGVRPYDLLRWFSREQAQGRLAITVFEYDLISNTALTHGHGSSEPPPEALLSQAAARIASQPTAATSEAAGVTLLAPDIISASAPALLHAEVRLPRGRVAAFEAPRDADHPLLLAASLMLVRLDKVTPVLLHLTAPAVLDDSGVVNSAFELDLGVLAGTTPAGDWLAYLLVGDTVTGPRPITVEAP
jgi:hypothetical protein